MLKPFILGCIFCFVSSFKQFAKYQISSVYYPVNSNVLYGKNGDDGDTDRQKPQKSTKFDRMVDDFMGKRYGNGQAFYGKRTSDLTEEEYQALRGPSISEKPDGPMRDNAILVVGGNDNVGQWVAFDLAEKGFTIRVSSEDRLDMISWYGVPGDNVDMIKLTPQSSEESYAKAIEGVQAIVFAGSFYPNSGGPSLESDRRYVSVASKLIEMANKARKAKVGEVQKLVQISRALPWTEGQADDWRDLTSGGPTLSPLQSFLDTLSGTADSASYEDFRSLHSILEGAVRRSGFDYAIVRAPPIVAQTRAAARYELRLVQSPVDLSDAPRALLQQSRGQLTLAVGQLDLAEAAVQSLLSDRSRVTFTVCEDPADPVVQRFPPSIPLVPTGILSLVDFSALIGQPQPNEWEPLLNVDQSKRSRPSRNTYYGILNMSDEEMRESYIIRSEESYLGQLTEDERVEKYWKGLLQKLQKDS